MRDLVGQKFGKLTVVKLVEYGTPELGYHKWECQCDCGEYIRVWEDKLTSGRVYSCGCPKRDKHRTLTEWRTIRARCQKVSYYQYESYGGKGIKLCAEWQKFSNFLNDMGYCPKDGALCRKNPSDDYTKENCYWATGGHPIEDTQKLEYNGELLTINKWAEKTGISARTILSRVRLGWDVEDILTTPTKYKKLEVSNG